MLRRYGGISVGASRLALPVRFLGGIWGASPVSVPARICRSLLMRRGNVVVVVHRQQLGPYSIGDRAQLALFRDQRMLHILASAALNEQAIAGDLRGAFVRPFDHRRACTNALVDDSLALRHLVIGVEESC